jgi:zinc protease
MNRPSAAYLIAGLAFALSACSAPSPAPTMPNPAIPEPVAVTPVPAVAPTPPPVSPLPPNIILPATAEPAMSVAAWVQVGSQDDPRGKEGLAWLTAQLMSRAATTAHRYDEILTLLYPMAASYRASVDREMTVISGRASTSDGRAFLRLFSEAFTKPAFAAADFERLRTEGVAYLEKNLRYALDEELGKAALHEALFRGSAYAHPIAGTVAGLKAITIDDVKAFWKAHYAADQVVFGLAGGWNDELRATVEATRAQLPPPVGAAAMAPPPPPTPALVKGRKVVLVNKPGADASISIGHLLEVRRGDPDFAALFLTASWLGEHRNSSSHLYQVIREARGLNYGDYAYVEAYPDGGRRQLPPANVGRRRHAFELWIRTLPNDNAVFALRAALRETDRLIDKGLTAEQFELTRNFLKKYVLHYAASTDDRLLWSIDDAFYRLSEPHLTKLRADLDALTLEQVNAAIKRHLRTSDLMIAIATGAPDKLKAQLTGTAPTLPTYPTPKPEVITKEDQEIGAYPLKIAPADITVISVDEIFGKSTRQ